MIAALGQDCDFEANEISRADLGHMSHDFLHKKNQPQVSQMNTDHAKV